MSTLKNPTELQEQVVLSSPEQNVLRTFREFLMAPGQMLCFHGPDLEKHRDALHALTERDFLVPERFKGGYSLTSTGFAAMKACPQSSK